MVTGGTGRLAQHCVMVGEMCDGDSSFHVLVLNSHTLPKLKAGYCGLLWSTMAPGTPLSETALTFVL